ncbi:cation efflux family-domain-containing protein [Dichotomocladium elegans]|nr:cation efflux family-domain-containing protein [Dichotomocladium elegans]
MTVVLCHNGSKQPQVDEYTRLIIPATPPSSLCVTAHNHTSPTIRSQNTLSTRRKLWFAVCMATLFFTTELVAGYFANSLALMSDAFHLLTDVASFIVALFAIYLAERPPTSKHTFGFHRAEVIAAMVSVFTIWILTTFLVHEAILRLQNPPDIDARLMCITASIGVAVNLVLDVNMNLRAASLHVLGDLIASIGVLLSSIILIFNPELTIVDPICTFIFAAIVLCTTFQLISDSLGILMECVPSHIHLDTISKALNAIPGVVSIHDLHVWSLAPGKTFLTVHIQQQQQQLVDYNDVLIKSQHILTEQLGLSHLTIQIEPQNAQFKHHCRPDLCYTNCYDDPYGEHAET